MLHSGHSLGARLRVLIETEKLLRSSDFVLRRTSSIFIPCLGAITVLFVKRRFGNCWILVALMKIKSDGRPRKHSSSIFCFFLVASIFCLVPVGNNYASQRDINFLRIINIVHHKLSNRRIFHEVLFKRLEKIYFSLGVDWKLRPIV